MAALLSACRPPAGERAAPGAGQAVAGPRDLLTIQTPAGLTLIDTRGGIATMAARRGVVAVDASAFASDSASGAADTAVEVRRSDGSVDFGLTVPGRLGARVVAPGGLRVALASGTATGGVPYRPAGRAETTIVVADRSGERRRLTLPGCVEPEAFSAEGDRLFVLDYAPPQQPERYRVRMIDLASGSFGPLLTRQKTVVPPGAEEEMRGEGRQAVYAIGRQLLFTLYTHQPDHEHTRDLLSGGARADRPDVHAFVHTLSTQIGFAYCIDLPAPFGLGPAAAHAIALDPRSEHPFVVDATSGTLARLNGVELAVDAIGSFAADASGGPAFASLSPTESALFIGTGAAVRVVDPRTLRTTATWPVPAPVRGLGVSLDGRRLWIGQPDIAVALDTGSGLPLARVPAPELTAIAHVG